MYRIRLSLDLSYKREAFRGSEFASRVLSDAGIPVIMKVSPLFLVVLMEPELTKNFEDGPPGH